MKKVDFLVLFCCAAVIAVFACFSTLLEGFNRLTADFPLPMSFVKFALLGTFGEMLALRIRRGCYVEKGFGVLPRMVVWGVLGVVIASAMMIFKSGTVKLLEVGFGMADAAAQFAGPLSVGKVLIALSVSVFMNTLFAPVFMTFHKITDIHIMETGGTLRGFFTHQLRIQETLVRKIDWNIQYGFIFKKTIPLFWYPAHTVTFLLPGNYQVLFAAFLGVVLGLILSIKK